MTSWRKTQDNHEIAWLRTQINSGVLIHNSWHAKFVLHTFSHKKLEEMERNIIQSRAWKKQCGRVILDYIALPIECQFNKNSLLWSYFFIVFTDWECYGNDFLNNVSHFSFFRFNLLADRELFIPGEEEWRQ